MFETSYRVPYVDTDQMGVVYYANYLIYFERSRTELIRQAGYAYATMEQEGFLLSVREAYCSYHAPARYDDMLTLRSRVTKLKNASLRIDTEVLCGGKLLVDGFVVLACTNTQRKACRLPKKFLNAIAQFVQPEEMQ